MTPEIARYYETFDEHARLSDAVGQLEFTRSLELLARFLPAAPARVLDIGGATGPYSEALAARGYEAHLLDLMPHHVQAAARRPGIASATLGDARLLPWPDEFADAVLLMGPLYHLTTGAERSAALGEARRVLKPGGVLAAAAISHFAPLLDGILTRGIDDPQFQAILLRDLESGQHRNTAHEIRYFTTAYFHRPDELAAELGHAGFSGVEVFAVEGVAGLAPDLAERWADRGKREFLLDIVRRTERDPSLAGATFHMLAIGRRA